MDYLMHQYNTKPKGTSIDQIFKKADPALLNILKRMIEFNPYFRPTASDILHDSYFDDIRSKVSMNPSFKIKANIDVSYQYDYEKECNRISESEMINIILQKIALETSKGDLTST